MQSRAIQTSSEGKFVSYSSPFGVPYLSKCKAFSNLSCFLTVRVSGRPNHSPAVHCWESEVGSILVRETDDRRTLRNITQSVARFTSGDYWFSFKSLIHALGSAVSGKSVPPAVAGGWGRQMIECREPPATAGGTDLSITASIMPSSATALSCFSASYPFTSPNASGKLGAGPGPCKSRE